MNLLDIATDFMETFVETYKAATPTASDMTLITVHCHCGEVWSYRRPRHYGGKAFSDKRCPACYTSQKTG